jgi:thymidylate synthase
MIFNPTDFSNNVLENLYDFSNNLTNKHTTIIDEIFDNVEKEVNDNTTKTLEEIQSKLPQLQKVFNFKTLSTLKKSSNIDQRTKSVGLSSEDFEKLSSIKDTILQSDSYIKLDEDIIDPLFAKNEDVPNPPDISPYFHEETQYINLIREIIKTGSYEKSRNGNTYTKFGYTMKYSLRNGLIPMITTKKLAWKSCFEELFWFIRGSTSCLDLQARGVSIWNGNGSREFLDGRGLYHLEEGDLGPIYGYQWRHYNNEYINSKSCYKGEGVDQLKNIIDELSNPETRSSRRLILTAWNPCQLSQMALPPCHVMAQFHVRENKYLSCALFQRSGDVGLGIPFNIASYSLLTHILAKHCGLEAEEFVHFLGNCHIYEEHVAALQTQQDREPMIFPRIDINKRDTIEEYCLDDISWITPYHSHPAIKMEMKV